MALLKIPDANAFVTIDVDDAPLAVGVVRLAPKILQGGAWDLARAMTYQLACFEHRASGASAGINAAPDARRDAIDAFVAGLPGLGGDRTIVLDAATGLGGAEIAGLRANDPRATASLDPADAAARAARATARGVVAAAEAAGGIDGRTVAVEGLREGVGVEVVRLVAERGGRLVGVSTATGAVTGSLDAAAVVDGWASDGADVVASLGDVGAPATVLAADADVLFVGSRTGAVDHDAAAAVTASLVVPTAPLPITARALAVLGRGGATVVPDFVATAGPLFAWWPPADAATDEAAIDDAAAAGIAAVVDEIRGHDEGLFLGACYRAEAFLSSWCDTLPFGRPLAS